jgi:hypothetical protein
MNKEMEQWAVFLQGRWQQRIPTKPGLYPIANMNGERIPDKWVVLNAKGKPVELNAIILPNSPKFTGWWWSESYPDLPAVPNVSLAA